MQFDWDKRKNRANITKHGVSFEVARLVFNDPWSITQADAGGHADEPRWQTIGSAAGTVILFVVHTDKDDSDHGEEIIRIISARKATARERAQYLRHHP